LSDAIARLPPPKPTALTFVHFCRCLTLAQGTKVAMLAVAEEKYPDDLTLHAALKSAVAAGGLGNWGELAAYRTMTSEFLEYARPTSIVLQLDNARRLPLRVRIAKVTAGATIGWVGEQASKPVTALAFSDAKLVACNA
jgi:hypothetical protein